MAPSITSTDFDHMRVIILNYAIERHLKKGKGFVYAPIEGCPCAYKEMCTYEKFINLVLKKDTAYLSNPRSFDDLMKFMKNYETDEMPLHEIDLDLLSFNNGILSLSSATFTPYTEIIAHIPRHPLLLSVSRHHIDKPYTGCSDTPLLDTVLNAQFETDVQDVLCALIGRLLFPVNAMDCFQVMPYLVGVGGTGKSLILSIIQHLFNASSIGNLAASQETTFGLANLVGKEVVIGRNMPAKLSSSIPQKVMQGMATGEGMEVARKNEKSINITWAATVIMASNHMPDYVNTGNNVGRRIVTLRFDNPISNPQETLLQDILDIELPAFVCRIIRAYATLREKAMAIRGGFWKAMPPKILEWQNMLAAA